jgi:hypothetical protein
LVLGVAVVFAGAAYITYTTMQRDAANRALIDEMFKPISPPPARLVVCRGTMDAACAQAAADKADTTVAWVNEPAGYELAWVMAALGPKGKAIASQYLVGADGQGLMEVVTSVPPTPGGHASPPSRSVSDGTDNASVWLDAAFGVVEMEWTHDGIEYGIFAQPRPWDPSAIVDAWKTVQYASPGSP